MAITVPVATVYLQADPLPNAAEMRWPDKMPADAVPVAFTTANWPPVAQGGDSIVQSSITLACQPTDMTATLLSCDGTTILLSVAGGTLSNPLTDYQVSVSFTTAQGIPITRVVYQRVNTLSQNQSYSQALSIIRGASISGVSVDENTGNLVFTLDNATNLNSVDVAGAIAASTALRTVTSVLPTDLVLIVRGGQTYGISGLNFPNLPAADYSQPDNSFNLLLM